MAHDWARWLADPRSRDAVTGLWCSWVADDNSGYPYEEATAWALGAGCGNQRGLAHLRAVLKERPLGRAGRGYLFDTAVALDAAITLADDELAGLALRHVDRMLAASIAVEGGDSIGEEGPQTHWSDAFGGHLLWLCRPLVRLGEQRRALRLCERLLPGCLRDGLVSVHQATDQVYAHAAAYAAEGLASLAGEPRDAAVSITRKLLAGASMNSGLVPAYGDHGPGRSDATAQTVALALLLGIDDPALPGMWRALAGLTADCGGLLYEVGSSHVNACATVFALRAAQLLAKRTFVQ